MTFYDLNMNSKRINNTQDPSANQDVATKTYADTAHTTPLYYPNLKRAGRNNGIIASSFDATFATTNLSTGLMSSLTGYPLFYALYLKAGTIVNGVAVYCGTSSGNPLGRIGGLYSKTGDQLAASAETTNTPTSQTVIQMNFTPYTILTDDFYYAAVNIFTNSSAGPNTLHASPAGAVFSQLTTLDTRALWINYPQTTTNNTGNLSLFRAATTTAAFNSPPTFRLPSPSISTFGLTLKPLGLQLWIGVY